MIQVRNYARGHKRIADVVEIEAPLVAHAFGEDLEDFFRRMIAPDTRVEREPLGIARARFADVGMREDALVAVEPAVGSPDETVQCLVRVLVAPAIKERFGRTIGNVIA